MIGILEELGAVVRHVEEQLGVRLVDEHFADGHDEIVHIFLHETCHAELASAALWVRDLPEEQHMAVDEVVARLAEDNLTTRLGLRAHTPAEHAEELARYPVRITVD